MRILFIGESWLGSCARSLREALARHANLTIDDVNEDAWFPKPRGIGLRVLNRLASRAFREEFNREVMERVEELRPDVVMTYKGFPVRASLLAAIRATGCRTVNVYPDTVPQVHGAEHAHAIGMYDLVISTKVFHPPRWQSFYDYQNHCVFVPQGYDPTLHLMAEAPVSFDFDVVMIASQRAAYEDLMVEIARELDDEISVAIGGARWEGHESRLPAHWKFLGNVSGRRYVSHLRRGQICIAPLTSGTTVGGKHYPGDVDTTRTYELSAAHCFFIHQRTDYVRSLFDEATEVPMFDDAKELAQKIHHYLVRPEERRAMASAAHRRSVPLYSIDERAADIIEVLNRWC